MDEASILIVIILLSGVFVVGVLFGMCLGFLSKWILDLILES